MKYTKDGVVEELLPEQVKKYVAHGWVAVEEQIKAVEEIIRLKPVTVKTKNTAKILDDIKQQGDE